MDFQPDIIYLKFENAKWRIHKDLERGGLSDGGKMQDMDRE